MVSFFAEVKIFRFWPKTMDVRRFDQNRGHSLRSFYSSLEGATELKICAILLRIIIVDKKKFRLCRTPDVPSLQLVVL